MMFGLIRKNDLDKLTLEYERKFSKLMSACDSTIKSVKEKCLGSDKMYARSNEIKFKSLEKRIVALEQLHQDDLDIFKEKIKDQEIKAADEAHDKIDV